MKTKHDSSVTQAVSGDVTAAATDRPTCVAGGHRADPPAEAVAVIEPPKPDDLPVAAGSDDGQPDPISNQLPAIWPIVMLDMAKRNQIGISRYKTPLQPFNGRDMLRDAYEEALDLAVYLRGAIYERDGQ